MTLAFDVSRCTGRMDLKPVPYGKWCEQRHSCRRFLAFTGDDRAAGVPNYRGIPVSMAVPDCGHKIEHEMEAQQ